MTLELFEQGPSVYIPVIAVSLLVTLIAYGAFPLLYARFKKKPLTASKYKWKCYGFNFIPMILFFLLSDRTPAGPYILWTSVFCHSGLKTLAQRNLITDNNVPVSTPSSATGMEHTGKLQQTAVVAATPVKQKKAKNRFCKLCGSPIDPATKKCTGCSKQYFKLPLVKKSSISTKVVMILSVLFIGLCLSQIIQYRQSVEQLQAEVEELSETVAALNNTIEELTSDNKEKQRRIQVLSSESKRYLNEKNDLKQTLSFYEEHVVFVPDDGYRMYHKYSCFMFDDSYFWAYNIEKAEQLGYSPCWVCCK